MKKSITLAALASTPALISSLNAQDYFSEIGIPTYTVAQPVENGFLNLPNGNLHLEFPIATVQARGGRKITTKLIYDSMQWRITYGNIINGGSAPIWFTDSALGPLTSTSGWRIVTEDGAFVTKANTSYSQNTTYCANNQAGNTVRYSGFAFVDSNGTTHKFLGPWTQEDTCPSRNDMPTASGYADDGSGYYLVVSNYYDIQIWAPDGTQITGAGTIDPNGNLPGDPLNRNSVTVTNDPANNNEYLDVLTSTGGTVRYTLQSLRRVNERESWNL